MTRAGRVVAAVIVAGLGVRLVRSRHRRFLHPDGRSFAGELTVWGISPPVGSDLLDRAERYPVTVRLSKGIGTRAGRPDILGLAVRVPQGGETADILLSTAGRGRFTRHLPVPRHSFDTAYGSITSYRTGAGSKVYLAGEPDRAKPALGSTLASVAAGADRAGLLLCIRDGAVSRPFGRVALGRLLPSADDEALTFNPVRNATADLYPTGFVHGTRKIAYGLSQRWRGETF